MLSWATAIALASSLPEAEQRDHFGSPSFRVRGRIFAQLSAAEGPQRRAILKFSAADQAALLMSGPDIFSAVPQWGRHGWTYVELAGVDAPQFRALLFQSWCQVVPKKLASAYAGWV